jgi:hypothetical protein
MTIPARAPIETLTERPTCVMSRVQGRRNPCARIDLRTLHRGNFSTE